MEFRKYEFAGRVPRVRQRRSRMRGFSLARDTKINRIQTYHYKQCDRDTTNSRGSKFCGRNGTDEGRE